MASEFRDKGPLEGLILPGNVQDSGAAKVCFLLHVGRRDRYQNRRKVSCHRSGKKKKKAPQESLAVFL